MLNKEMIERGCDLIGWDVKNDGDHYYMQTPADNVCFIWVSVDLQSRPWYSKIIRRFYGSSKYQL